MNFGDVWAMCQNVVSTPHARLRRQARVPWTSEAYQAGKRLGGKSCTASHHVAGTGGASDLMQIRSRIA